MNFNSGAILNEEDFFFCVFIFWNKFVPNAAFHRWQCVSFTAKRFISRWLWLDNLSVKQTRKRTGLSFFYNRLWTSGEWKLSRSQIYEMLLDIYGIFLEAEKTKIDCICIYIYVRQVKLNLLFFPLSIFGGMSLSASYILHSQNRRNKAIILVRSW